MSSQSVPLPAPRIHICARYTRSTHLFSTLPPHNPRQPRTTDRHPSPPSLANSLMTLYFAVAALLVMLLVIKSLGQTTPPSRQLASFPTPDRVLQPGNVMLDSAENVWTINTLGNTVVVLAALNSTTQPPLSLLEQFGDTTRGFNEPYAIAVDFAVNPHVADCGNHRVVVLAALTSTSAKPRSGTYSVTAKNTLYVPALSSSPLLATW